MTEAQRAYPHDIEQAKLLQHLLEQFYLPYRCLLPKNVDGRIMGAGRSVSAEESAP